MLIGRNVSFSFIQGKSDIITKKGIILDKILMTTSKENKTEHPITGYLILDEDTNKVLSVAYWRITEIHTA
jgi:hypothetical protein